MPVEVLNATVTAIDGGKDPSSGQVPRSRMAASGMARRARRRFKRRRQRLRRLARYLAALGYLPTDSSPKGRTYEAWKARRDLATRYEPDEAKKSRQLGLAIMHIARHRGWRSPWWSYKKLECAPAPTATFRELQERAAAVFHRPTDEFPTIGAIGAAAANPRFTLRLRTREGSAAARNPDLVLFHRKILQEDVLHELKRILEVQKVEKCAADAICQMVFEMSKPFTPSRSVGKDPVPQNSSHPRAPRSSLEFQELRVRQALASLRVVTREDKRRLTREEGDRLAAWLLEADEAPSWADVAVSLGLEPDQLAYESFGGQVGNRAPINATRAAIEVGRMGWPHIAHWWAKQASREERELFACFLGDATDSDAYALIEGHLEGFPEVELVKLMDASGIPRGRAPYSRKTMRELSDYMARHGVDLSGALMGLYGLPSTWRPPAPSLFERLEYPHSTLDQITRDIARWLQRMVSAYGTPELVAIGHAREALMSAPHRAEALNEVKLRRQNRERMREDLALQGIPNPTDQDVRRYRSLTMQNRLCLYCGDPISMATCELDHIVPRAIGGSIRAENMVAVCKRCGHAKGKQVFSQWAATTDYASVDEAVARVDEWRRPQDLSPATFTSFKRDVKTRLKRKSRDGTIDERSLASTNYPVREIAERIESYLASLQPPVDTTTGEVLALNVRVLSRGAISEARRASNVDEKIKLPGSWHKVRMDRRHHTIDAAVATTLNLIAAKVLAERRELRELARSGNDQAARESQRAWREHEGSTPLEVAQFRCWKERSARAAELLERAIAEDRVTVRFPLRLGASVGRLHDDMLMPLYRKAAREAFSPNEVLAIANPAVYKAALPLLDAQGGLQELDRRQRSGSVLDDPAGIVELFPSWDKVEVTPHITVRGGCARIGGTLHHARLYAVPTWSGHKLYQLRVFAGEFGAIGFLRPGTNLFRAALPVWSQSYRAALKTLRRAIEHGTANYLGWLVPGDELEFPLDAHAKLPKFAPPSQEEDDARELPITEALAVRRWRVSGFENARTINLKPQYLAIERLTRAELNQLRAREGGLAYFGNNGWRLPVSRLLELNPTIIRRTATGAPRWREAGGLPTSWRLNDRLSCGLSNENA